jgi:hypothetical protein
MKYLALLAILFSSCNQDPATCQQVKTGTFTFESGSSLYKIVRTANEQSETNLTTGETSTWGVAWQDDCTYVITLKRRSTNTPTQYPTQTIKITKVTGNNVYFESHDGEHALLTGRMEKVK